MSIINLISGRDRVEYFQVIIEIARYIVQVQDLKEISKAVFWRPGQESKLQESIDGYFLSPADLENPCGPLVLDTNNNENCGPDWLNLVKLCKNDFLQNIMTGGFFYGDASFEDFRYLLSTFAKI